jgi:uncharacterized glyoxalase superfamily protein PhnB
MAKTQTATPAVIPFLRYADAPAAIDWLCEAFGFERQLVVPNDDGTIAHAELIYENGMVMLGSAREDQLGMKTARELGAVNQGIYVVVDDTDAHYERAKAAGTEIVWEPRDEDYGSREYLCRDLEGNVWSFGTYRPELP